MVKIIADTLACLTPEVAERYQIPVIPQVINFGDESYYEEVEMDAPTFLARLKASEELPKTAAPPPGLFTAEFERLAPLGEPILCIHPSAQVSGTVSSATAAMKEFPEANIRIIDTKVIATPLGTMVTLAAEWAEEGLDADTIEARLADLTARCRIYFMVDTLEYLARGGRIGGASALLGSMLQMKPILTFKDGQVDQYDRTRTHKRAVAQLKQLVLDQIPRDGSGHLSVMHADALDEAREIAAELKEILGLEDVPIANVPPAIVTHAGPGVLGAGFFVSEAG
jgi:DegV family protein with EDD domain